MREVYRNSDSGLVALYRSVLEDAGIVCHVYNWTTQQAVFRGCAAALVPLPMFFPTLCVVNDDDYAEAMSVLRTPAAAGADWTCASCGETVPGNFTSCWKCQAARVG
ncbi:MAG TPA: DUF2007 domain-containing protein [Chthoniobacteraceae bacterium]|jgi:hypothetical protein|nr:DUF2007 domain-containing protein [Chthoniobacteraceae bacterium]